MVKWDTSTVVAWMTAAAATGKIVFDYVTGGKDRSQKTVLAEHQIESTERIDLTKILKDSLDSLRQDVVRLDKKSTDNELAWITQVNECITLKGNLNEMTGEVLLLRKNNHYYEEVIEQYQRENVELRDRVSVLTQHVNILQNDNYVLQKEVTSIQHQVNQNSEAIIMDVLPVGGPEMILAEMVRSADKFTGKELGE